MTKMKHIAKAQGLFLILALLILSLPPAPAWAQNPPSSSKISSLLALQVETKLRLSQGELPEAMANILKLSQQGNQPKTSSPHTGNLTTQRLFVHLAEPPTQLQIRQLQTLGITLYPDSWIPPLGNHPTGFLIADMPLDKLNELAARDYVLSLDSAERTAQPQNDLGATAINVPEVWSSGYNGSGIKIAILDSGLDVNHPDIPPPVAARDYSDWPNLDDTIANRITGHGTHVSGTALGRGTQSAEQYKGTAPASDLIFLKIGNDDTAGAPTPAITNAITDAVDIYDADIITMSYGGWDVYHDGSSPEAQAVDYACSKGAVVFVSAGNEATKAKHYSGTVPPGGETDYIPVNVGSQFPFLVLYFNLVWYDALGTHNDLDLHYYDSSYNELTNVTSEQSESQRGTQSELSRYNYLASPGSYYLKVKNNSSASQLFHIYEWLGWMPITFPHSDPLYTISTPADADNAIAVGAYTTRKNWTDYEGNSYSYPGETVGTVSSFSSRGPRVDDVQKPNIVAPGCIIASCRDRAVYPCPYYNANADIYPYYPFIIDNDGLNLDGSGPADYFLMAGTSMASPMAAGAAALLLQAHPEFQGNPAAVRDRLQQTASMAHSPDYISGYGVLDAYQAITSELGRKGDFDSDGHIDLVDFFYFAMAYGSNLGDENYNPIADFDNDGVINISDFFCFAQVYGT